MGSAVLAHNTPAQGARRRRRRRLHRWCVGQVCRVLGTASSLTLLFSRGGRSVECGSVECGVWECGVCCHACVLPGPLATARPFKHATTAIGMRRMRVTPQLPLNCPLNCPTTTAHSVAHLSRDMLLAARAPCGAIARWRQRTGPPSAPGLSACPRARLPRARASRPDAADSSVPTTLYQGVYGPWSIEPQDVLEVYGYRAGLTATALGGRA